MFHKQFLFESATNEYTFKVSLSVENLKHERIQYIDTCRNADNEYSVG